MLPMIAQRVIEKTLQAAKTARRNRYTTQSKKYGSFPCEGTPGGPKANLSLSCREHVMMASRLTMIEARRAPPKMLRAQDVRRGSTSTDREK